jgi:chitinase
MRMIVGFALTCGVLCMAAAPALAAKPRISVGDVTVDEGAGLAQIPVSLSKKAPKKVAFSFATEDREALAGFDYTATSGSNKIAAKKRSATISVPVSVDDNDDYDRYFVVRLLSAKRARLADASASVTIADDDPPPTIAVTTDAVAEGGAPLHDIEVKLSQASYKLVDFTWSVKPLTATAGEDLVAAGGTAPIGPGNGSNTFSVGIEDDAIDEFDETFEISLSDVHEATASETSHVVSIGDNDSPPTVGLATASVAEGTSGTHTSPVLVALSGPSAKPIELDYASTAGTAAAPADFTVASGHLAFAPGATAAAFNLTTVGDYDDEPDETVGVAFSAPVNVALPSTVPTLGITDDDPACVAADSPGSAVNLGAIDGDQGSGGLTRNDLISPCGDTDWFSFVLAENSSSVTDLHGRLILSSGANDSPQGGDVDLCARISGNAGSEVCSQNAGGGAQERIDICIEDPVGGSDQTTAFQVEVSGFGNAVNNYSLQIAGNQALGTGPTLHIGC